MKCVSTENPNIEIDFDHAILNSLPSIGGLWFPKNIDKLPDEFFKNMCNMTFKEICNKVLHHLLQIDEKLLAEIVDETFNFPLKIHSINSSEHFLETYWGPTHTFKDFGARFMANYLQKILHKKYCRLMHKPHFTVIVSTSGDTGSAIASAFLNKPNFNVIILYPNNKISDAQEMQITTYGKNIISFAIDSDFDACQQLAKKTLVNPILKTYGNFISANSINIARLIPQCLYYFYAYSQLKKTGRRLAFVVPCGNCGNLTGGLLAQKMGLPIDFFIAAQNDNNSFERSVNTGIFSPKPTIPTISNAMDVGNPSNIKRINYLFKDKINLLRENVKVMSVSQQDTKDTIKFIYDKYKYIIDPHTAVASAAYKKLDLSYCNIDYVFVSTAHPAKFAKTIKDVLNINCTIPQLELLKCIKREKFIIKEDFKSFNNILEKVAHNRSVVLIGMPGAGKTSVAKKIHELYDIKYVDLDEKIEAGYSMSLFEILDKFQEDGLTLIEEQAILSLNTKISKIISTGGSVIYSESGMEHLRQELVIYLKTDFSVLQKRTDNFTNRGIIFNGKTPEELYAERTTLYEKNCDIILDCANQDCTDLAYMITNQFIYNKLDNPVHTI